MVETTGYVDHADEPRAPGPTRGNVFARIGQPHRRSRTACFDTVEGAMEAADGSPAHIVLWGWKWSGEPGVVEPVKVTEYWINEAGHVQ